LALKCFLFETCFIFLEELGAAFFPTEWGQPLTFDLGPAGLHHPALLHTTLHGPPMVGFFNINFHISIKNKQISFVYII
jgi:hypothetical protein